MPGTQLSHTCQPGELIRNTASIEGYTDKQSYEAGETVFFYIHSRTPKYNFKLYRFGENTDLISTLDKDDGAIQNYLCYSYSWGCDWDVTMKYKLPENLKSGIYSASISNDFGNFWVSFVVTHPFKTSDIALMASTNTWCAYNQWGGGSFYNNTVEEETKSSENISFLRPNLAGHPYENQHLAGAEVNFIKWLEKKGYSFDMYADIDLHTHPGEITNHKVIILSVHPEYYTETMYNSLVDYVKNGGHLMYLGANGLYGKVVINPLLKILELRRENTLHYYDGSVGGLWRSLNKPESALLGVQYDARGYDTYHPYSVRESSHWVFNGTNLKNGDTFGTECVQRGGSGHETDKITKQSPQNLIHLAKGTNPDGGGADMVYYENVNRGKVFSTGSITYVSCINSDSVVSTITKNVLDKFLK
ncbi:MAG: hypothetical protein KDC83_10595 [Flavobacteriales bacterium]|nr:hypothetical protein [Flavobacteriales bacterium]